MQNCCAIGAKCQHVCLSVDVPCITTHMSHHIHPCLVCHDGNRQPKGMELKGYVNNLGCTGLVQVPQGSRIVSMTLNRRGTRLLVNCYDRTVRLYETCQPGKRRRSYTPADLKSRLAAAKVCNALVC